MVLQQLYMGACNQQWCHMAGGLGRLGMEYQGGAHTVVEIRTGKIVARSHSQEGRTAYVTWGWPLASAAVHSTEPGQPA